jgi:hypothetical protein
MPEFHLILMGFSLLKNLIKPNYSPQYFTGKHSFYAWRKIQNKYQPLLICRCKNNSFFQE